jgi:DNA-binding protein HU-beta
VSGERRIDVALKPSREDFVPNKAQFVEMLADRLDGDRKRAAAALDAVIDSVYAAIARGEKVAITGFGVFERRDRAARTARNPATGAPVRVAASRVPAFRPGAEFKAIASGAKEFAEGRVARAQDAVTKTAARVRDAQDRAAAVVKDAADAVREAPAKAAAAVKKSTSRAPAKKSTSSASSAAKKAPAAAKSAAKKSAPAKKATSAKKTAAKKTTAKKSAPAKKTAAKKSGPAKKSTAKKTTAKKAPAKKR